MGTDEPKTLTVPAAGWLYFKLGRNASYAAARRGEIPTLRFGRKLVVPIVALERKLLMAGDSATSDTKKGPDQEVPTGDSVTQDTKRGPEGARNAPRRRAKAASGNLTA